MSRVKFRMVVEVIMDTDLATDMEIIEDLNLNAWGSESDVYETNIVSGETVDSK